MYSYSLLVDKVDRSGVSVEWEPVRPGPDMMIPTLAALQAQVRVDLGFVPDWLTDCNPQEYLGVEEEVQVHSHGSFSHESTWFCLCIEGSEPHVMPPLAQMIAWERAARSAPKREPASVYNLQSGGLMADDIVGPHDLTAGEVESWKGEPEEPDRSVCINVLHNEIDCETAGLPSCSWCEPCKAKVEREVRLEEARNADLIEYYNLRGITPPDY